MAADDLSDAYVANLLKEDAKKASKNYAMGLGGHLPHRPTANAPKPNTRFLRTILRETDNHNQALLAKEAEEAKARLKALRNNGAKQDRSRRDGQRLDRDESRTAEYDDDHRSKRRRVDILATDRNRLSPPRESKRHRPDYSPDHDEGSWTKKRACDNADENHDRKSHHSSGRHRRRREEYSDDDAEQRNTRAEREHHESRRQRSRSHSINSGLEDAGKRVRYLDKHYGRSRPYRDRNASRSRSRDRDRDGSRRKRRRRHSPSSISRSRSRSYSPRRDKTTIKRRKRRSSTPEGSARSKVEKRSRGKAQPLYSPPKRNGNSQEQIPEPESDSDPLAGIVGPLPPRPPPKIKVRGRGAFSASAMDTHFSSTYDPSADVVLGDDEEGDWEQALEALRDRQKYKQQHGDRLRAAGFTEEEVKKWEKGGEKGEEDVRWAKKGEGREWDRGKVVGSDGHIEIKAEWGRLKDT